MAKEAEKQKFCNSMKYIIEIEDKDSDTCDNLLPTILKCFNEEQSRKFNS